MLQHRRSPGAQSHPHLLIAVALELNRTRRALRRAGAAALATRRVDPGRAAEAFDACYFVAHLRDGEGAGADAGQAARATLGLDDGHNPSDLNGWTAEDRQGASGAGPSMRDALPRE